MRKENLLKWVLFLTLLPAFVSARENTPLETFIRHVKETNTFVQVNNIWQPDNNFDKTEILKSVSEALPLTIDYNNVVSLMKQNHTAINLVIPGSNGNTYTIELAQYNFLSNDFQVHAMGYNNSDGLCDYTPGVYYSGIVKGIPGSLAAFSFFKNEVYGIFSIPGEGNYVLAPNTLVGEYYNYNRNYILYNDNDLLIKDQAPGCATDKLPMRYRQNNLRTTTTLNNNVYSTCRQVKVFEVADRTTFVKKGSSTTNVTNYFTALFNNQSTIYRNEGVPIALSYVQIDTVADVYGTITSQLSIRYLHLFGYTTQNTMHGCNVALLFTTHSGSMGGVAWLQAACTGYYAPDSAGPYGFCNINNSNTTTSTAFPTYSWDVEVSTHEMGHLVGSPHTHACCWNPPLRNTAIDGCTTQEGSCADPGNPSGGGTIMSYCHLTSVGIAFTKGFGQQPGDTVKYYLAANSCGSMYTPSVIPTKVNRIVTANRECVDLTGGMTYYFKDNNTVSPNDDTLVLLIAKNGNNIGNLNTAGFSVTSGTEANYGNGAGDAILFPAGTSWQLAPNYSMHRYWKVKATTEPTTAVEVILPFSPTDSADIDGSAPGNPAPGTYKMYKVHNPINPSPLLDSFRYTTTSNVVVYGNAATASTTKWSLSIYNNVYYAHMLMTNLSGGGSGFYSSLPSGLDNISTVNPGIYIYPNPTTGEWFVSVEKSNTADLLSFALYTVDGKMLHSQMLQSGSVNTISSANLSAGIYFYRLISNNNVYTGNLIKR